MLTKESHGNPRAYNPTGCGGRGCGGLWQFDPWTWRSSKAPGATYRGYAYAQDAPAEVQNDRAREAWNGGRGCSNWAAC